VKQIKGREFEGEFQVGPIRAEVRGELTRFESDGNWSEADFLIKGPGVDIKVTSRIEISDQAYWIAEVKVSGPLAPLAEREIQRRAQDFVRSLVACALG